MVARCLLIFFRASTSCYSRRSSPTFWIQVLYDPKSCLDRATGCGGLLSGSYGALKYWIDQHDVQRGGQPWFYYLLLLGLYEFIPLTLTIIAAAQRKFNLFGKFCLAWSIGALLVYSYAGEKMPWLILHLTLPMILTGAPVLARWIQGVRPATWRSTELRYAVGLWLSVIAFAVSFVAIYAVQWLNVIDQQALGLERLMIIVVILGAIGGLVWLARRSHLGAVRTGAVCALLLASTAFYIRTSWLATYEHGDTPRDMLIYVQSSPDVVWVTRELERIGAQTARARTCDPYGQRVFRDGGRPTGCP